MLGVLLTKYGSTLGNVGYVGITLRYVGNDLACIAFASILLNISSTFGYFWSTLRFIESSFGYNGSIL